jgi:WD40 repeat protein
LENNLKDYLDEALDSLQIDVVNSLEKERKGLREIGPEPPVNVKGFKMNSKVDFPNAKRSNLICFGTGGISRRPGTMDFLGLSEAGSLFQFKGATGQVSKELQLQVKRSPFWWSCVEFNPSGSHFLTAITYKKELSVFASGKFKKCQKWVREDFEAINRAKWVDDHRILAGFEKPGNLVLYLMGSRSPILQIAPRETKTKGITDVDVSKNGQHAFCGTWNPDLVFKVKIEENGKFEWRHSGHRSQINSLRLSGNEKFVLSGGFDKKEILASSKNGKSWPLLVSHQP